MAQKSHCFDLLLKVVIIIVVLALCASLVVISFRRPHWHYGVGHYEDEETYEEWSRLLKAEGIKHRRFSSEKMFVDCGYFGDAMEIVGWYRKDFYSDIARNLTEEDFEKIVGLLKDGGYDFIAKNHDIIIPGPQFYKARKMLQRKGFSNLMVLLKSEVEQEELAGCAEKLRLANVAFRIMDNNIYVNFTQRYQGQKALELMPLHTVYEYTGREFEGDLPQEDGNRLRAAGIDFIVSNGILYFRSDHYAKYTPPQRR